ncbi:MAG: cobyrinate a,c-diamide synthase [Cyanobacteria bacterium J06623_4]
MSIILAGDRSGTGKTTLTLALLAALKRRSHSAQSFKVGPDYIDPMYHSAVTGHPCYNLDPVLTSEAYVQQSFRRHCQNTEQAVVEGVMGLFDGATGTDDTASTAHIARLLGLAVVLVVDCGRMARSLAALVQGYRQFDSRVRVAGVVLNRVGSDRHLQLLSDALAAIDMPIFGVFRREKAIQLPSRHLGLVPTGEISEFAQIAARLADIGDRCFDWEKLMPLLAVGSGRAAEDGNLAGTQTDHIGTARQDGRLVRIAIARDAAFNFYYPDNLEALEAQGAQLIFWSPMEDETLPAADGLYFGGGFPEVFAAQLSENKAMRLAIRAAINRGIPTYAECGGLMYLSETLVDFEERAWPMVGAVAQTVHMGNRLSLGYRKAHSLRDGPLLKKGQTLVGHEFHKSSVSTSLAHPAYQTQRFWGEVGSAQAEGHCQGTLHASYLHLHWGDRPDVAQRFVEQCRGRSHLTKPANTQG